MGAFRRTNVEGLDCWLLENRELSLWLSADFGPRVMGLSFQGGENLLAVLPEAELPLPSGVVYTLRGGHRLWYAPERPETTYLPDDRPPSVRELSAGLEFIQEIDQPTGIQKSWQIKLEGDEARVVLDHRLTNLGDGAVVLAPWAVTMLRPGGVGLLPLSEQADDEHGLWPNRQLVLWPYTDIRSPHLQLFNQGVFLSACLGEGALKIGAPNPLGFLAYRQNGQLFVKQSRYQQGMNYLDRGASHQIYCNPQVIELETLGPMVELAPGQAVEHQEVWQVYPEGAGPAEIEELWQLGNLAARHS